MLDMEFLNKEILLSLDESSNTLVLCHIRDKIKR